LGSQRLRGLASCANVNSNIASATQANRSPSSRNSILSCVWGTVASSVANGAASLFTSGLHLHGAPASGRRPCAPGCEAIASGRILWCTVEKGYGQQMSGEEPESPEAQPLSKAPAAIPPPPSAAQDDAPHASGHVHAHHSAIQFRFLEQLKRRNVIRVGILYLVVCWLVLHPAYVVFHMLEVPVWANRLVVILMAIGFPAVLVFAWAYEVTPEGLKPTAEVDPHNPIRQQTGQRLNRAIGVVLVLAVAYLLTDKFWLSKHTQTEQVAPPVAAGSTAATPASTAISEKSIAVLPFADMSENHDQEYFADGMAEEVLDLLANIPGLRVISRTSSFQFKGLNQDLRTVGSALGVSYVVEGSVRRSGERLRITAQLIGARDGTRLWSGKYDEPVGDTFKVQDQIAGSLVRALQVTVGADYQQLRPPLKSVEGYDLYLRGLHALDRWDKEGLESAAAYFQQALELEPTSVPAAEWLAFAQQASAEFGYVEPHEGFERARLSAHRALELDPNSSLAYVTLSAVHLIYDWDWAAAERDAKQALRLKPRDPISMGQLGQVYVALGRWDESARLLETALTLDPLFAGWHTLLSGVRYATGKLSEAEAEARKVLQISPTYGGGHAWLGYVLLAQGKFEAALTKMQQERPDSRRDTGLAIVYHAMGRRIESDAALTQLIRERAQDAAYDIAQVYAYRGELDRAFTWLERAYRQKDEELFYIKGIRSDPLMKKFAADPRYAAFLRKMNLPE
jgi:adenylate cyclase